MTVPALLLATAASLALAVGPWLPDFGLRSPAAPSVVDRFELLEWDTDTPAVWGERRDVLYAAWEDGTTRTPDERFRLAAQLGRAAALASEPVAPFFERTPAGVVNVFYREALALDAEAMGTRVAGLEDPRLRDALRTAAGTPPDAPPPSELMSYVASTATIPWNALSPRDWNQRADRLLEGYRTTHERLQQAELLRLLGQIGRTSAHGGRTEEPVYGEVRGQLVNRAWLAAAMVELASPGLLEATIKDTAVVDEIEQLRQQVLAGDLPMMAYRDALVP